MEPIFSYYCLFWICSIEQQNSIYIISNWKSKNLKTQIYVQTVFEEIYVGGSSLNAGTCIVNGLQKLWPSQMVTAPDIGQLRVSPIILQRVVPASARSHRLIQLTMRHMHKRDSHRTALCARQMQLVMTE